MPVKTIVPGIHQISLGFVNVFLLDGNDGVTLIDTGIPGSDRKILAAIEQLGKHIQDVHSIVITHLHADHTGSLFALKDATGAEVYAHAEEAGAIRVGQTMRAVQPAPGWFNALIVGLMMRPRKPRLQMPVAVEHEVRDGDELPGGLMAVHTPGHTAGHLALLWPHHGGVFFLGDAATAMFRLGYPPIFEDFELGQRSLKRIAGMDFETACCSHGQAFLDHASEKFRQKWS